MNWKTTVFKRSLIALLLVLLGVEAYMEFIRYPCDEISVTSTNTERILRRVPEVSITEEDKALLAELMELPSVQSLLEKEESKDIRASEDPKVAAAAEKYLSEEDAGSLNVGTLFLEDGFVVTMGWMEGKSIFYLQITPEEDGAPYYKLYSPKRGTSYENWDNQRARKNKVHRRWLAWLRDGMWKEGE